MQNVFCSYTAVEFRRIFRVSVDCFHNLCQLLFICPEMDVRLPYFGGRQIITLEKTVLVVLRHLGHLGHQENVRLLSDIFDISDSSVVMCRDRVINAILNNLLDRYIS
jgi:hypothetical protein